MEVTRGLAIVDAKPGAAFEMTLEVAVGDGAPNGLIIEERLPGGWRVEESTWNGSRTPLGPVVAGGAHKWLFDPVDEPVANGRLTIRVAVPLGADPGEHVLEGLAKWLDQGTEVERETDGDSAVNVLGSIALEVQMKWNLLSLPFELEQATSMWRAFTIPGVGVAARGVISTWDPAAGEYVTDTWLPGAKQGFWVSCDASGRTSTLYGAPVGDGLPLSPGWNLVGPTRAMLCDELFDDYGVLAVWGWDAEEQTFFRLRHGDALDRGKGCWVYVLTGQGRSPALPR